MKRTLICFVLAMACLLMLTACGKTEAATETASEGGVWADAAYTEDTELGEGTQTLTLEVTAEDKTVTFTVHTDAETVGEALEECGLIEGEEGQYGLYIKVVDGITADYDADGTYWAFYENGEYAANSVDATAIETDVIYGLTKAKG